MKIIDKLSLRVERAYAIVSTQLKHKAPEIEMILGSALIFSGAIAAYKAGKRSKEEDFKGQYEERKKEIENSFTPRSLKDKEKRKAAVKYIASEARNVALATGCTVGGVFLVKNAFDNVSRSKRLLEGALAASVAAAHNAQDILIENMDPDERDALVNGAKFDQKHTKQLNDDGSYSTKLITNTVFNVNDIFDLPGESFIYSKETCASLSYQDNRDYFYSLVIDAEANAERRLKHTHGYCFDADIVKLFGVDPKPIHRTCGCVMPDPKRPRPGDENRRGCLHLNTQPIQIEYDDGSRTNGWLITPISDGSIIDIYPEYSLQRLLVKNRLEREAKQ